MSIWKDFTGIFGTSFRIGYGAANATFTINVITAEDGTQVYELNIDRILNAGANPIRTTYKATNDDELCNLKTLMELLSATETTAYSYIDEKVREITGGTTGGNVMLSPISVELKNIPEGDGSFGFGTLSVNKFIDRIIFGVTAPFFLNAPKTLQFSVGSSENAKEDIVPKFSIDTLQSTKVINV